MNEKHIKENKISDDVLEVYKNLYSVSFYNSIVVFEKRKEEALIFTEVASK
jgi:hypothetical protein